MEVQLEEEYEDKQKVLRDKRELECKLLNAQEQVPLPPCTHTHIHTRRPLDAGAPSDFREVRRALKEMRQRLLFVAQVGHRDVETERRLRKDLKRTKVLLADAQIMLDHLKSNAPSKREIAQLKNQVSHPIRCSSVMPGG